MTLAAAADVGLTKLADDAAGHLQGAANRAHRSVPLRVVGSLPVLRDQVAGIRNLADAAATLGAVGAEAAHRINPMLERAGEPAGRLALLDVTLNEVDRIDVELRNIALGDRTGLLPPLRNAHDDLTASLTRARARLEESRALIAPVREMLAGPTTFLLLVANNAEMAGGGGLALSAGLLTFDQGEIELGDVIPASDLRLDEGVPVPGDLGAIYIPTGVGVDLRSTTRSPNLELMGPVAAAIMAKQGVPDLDGVLVVDALALQAMLGVTGGVSAAGQTIDADNVLVKVLHETYLTYQTLEERDERVSFQGEIAKAVFASLTDRTFDATSLAEALVTTSKGRHIVLWSADPALQSVWEKLGMAGALDERGLLISFQNYGADKMDWYLRPDASLQVTSLASGDYRARLTMRVRIPANDEIPDASPQILGAGPENHAIFLTVHLPAAAYDIQTPDGEGFRTEGVDPPMQVRTFLEDVPAGTVFERQIAFSLPRSVSSMVLLPSARMVPLPLTIDDRHTIDDAVPQPFTWSVAPGGEAPSPWVRATVLAGLLASLLASSSLAVAAVGRQRGQPDTRWLRTACIAGGAALGCLGLAGILGMAL